ncbi:MAG TPA: PAS domain-containing protein [Acidobacteriaceae bacterium]|nr:PAS domain-containing protein [Acidobacteriaceae bacterium]
MKPDDSGGSPEKQTPVVLDFLAGGGELGARVRALDWAKTPLGPISKWPQSLKTSVSTCLNSRFPMLIWWGPDLVKIYNDAYRPLIGSKHPWALGIPGREVWPEIWNVIGPMLNQVMERGEATVSEDLLLLLERDGYGEECYFSFSYSPIRDESGRVEGVFTPVIETTDRVISARRLHTLRDLASVFGTQTRNANDACVEAVKVLAANPYDLPFAVIYLFDAKRTKANLIAHTGPPNFPGKIDLRAEGWRRLLACTNSESCVLDLSAMKLDPLPQAPWGHAPEQAIAVPIVPANIGEPIGFLLAGISIRKRLDESYRSFYAQVADQIASTIWEADAVERERELRETAEAERSQIRELFLNAPAGIMVTTGPEHHITLANRQYVELIGRSLAGEIVGKPIRQALPELEDQPFFGWMDEVYRTGVPFVGREVMARLRRRPSGKQEDAYFNFVYQPHRSADGRIDGLLIHAVDITDQVRARQEIETREEQFRVLADSIPQLAWMANPDGSISWYNRRWYEYTGTTFDQMQGWGWQSVHNPDLLPVVLEKYEHCLKSGEPFEMTFPLRGADGEFRMFLTLASPVRDKAGTIVRWFGTNTDIDAQRKAETGLRQAEKLAVVGRLAASIAHEINNPLEAVMNLIFLARLTVVNEETAGYLKAAEEELSRVSQIASQALRFHKQQSSAMATDMVELLDSVLTLYRGKLTRNKIQVNLETSDCPHLVCYAGEIRQLLANLVGNAADAMSNGGTLRLRVRPVTDWRHGEPGVRVTISDTGHGMPPDVRRRIYEPFFTTKGEIGTGLGLWVSAGIVDKHRGSIHVRSRPEQGRSGTTFTVILPLSGPPTRSAEETSVEAIEL